MSKNKSVSIDPLCRYSPDFLFEEMKGKVRNDMILLKAKVSQYQEKKISVNQRKNISMDETGRRNIDALVKQEKYRAWLQRQNPESQNQIQQMEQDTSGFDQKSLELSQEQKIYIEFSVLKYDHKMDYGRKWKININPQIDYSYLKDSEVFEILTYMYMFQSGYFPFVAEKTQTKTKIYVQLLSRLKKRASQNIVTFKAPFGKDNWIIFSFMVERLQKQIYTICVEINQIRKDLILEKINFQIDKRFQQKKYKIAPGQIQFKFDKNLNLKPEQIFMFGQKNFQFNSIGAQKTRKVFPSKVEVTKIALRKGSQVEVKQSFACQIQIHKDNTNYESIRHIYKELENNDYFSYTLSAAEYDVLETKGNLIVIGRSGTGKTTCALLRLFFKEINNIEKTQKNVFLTASPVLIAEINKKYDQLKDGIRQLHNVDYFEQNQVIFDERNQIRSFYDRLDEINQASMRQRTGSFLSNKIFPCFLTVNEYIESIDANMNNSFFSGRKSQRENEQEIVISYPDQIQWEQKIRRTRRIRNSNQQGPQFNQQESTEIRFEQFAKEIYPLPEIKRLAGRLSPEIIWSEIYSIIKGSSRAHSFIGRCLDFKTYNEESQSKNKFFSKEDRQRIYEIFSNYDRIMKETGRHDLLDVVNNVIWEMGQRQNNDLALSSLFIDEVQDLPPAFIFLAGKIVQQSLFFCGDTAQTIAKGVNFSFSDIRELFSQKYFEKGFKLQKPQIKRLGANFRSQKQIIQLSNSLIKCLTMMFPQSIDSIPEEISYDQGPKPVIMSSKDSHRLARILRSQFGNINNNRNNMFGADKAIIVRKKSAKQKIPKQLSEMTCLTYEQCKGLEYDVVILYDFFTQSPEIQWSYLKHIEVQTSPKGVKSLAFDKNCRGSNMKMYFDLCTQLKILYTVITRPRTKLIICDDNIPEHLLRIWKSLDLVQDAPTFYRSQQARLQENMANNNVNRPNPNNPLLRENQQMNVLQVQNQDQNFDRRNEQNFQRYRKQWAEQGFKFFFDRKFYDQAVNCFRNAQLPELQQISKAFFFASYACNGAQTVQDKKQFYTKAAFIFEKHRRKYQAAKCYYLGGQYKRALSLFEGLGIKKYQAECHWKLKEYDISEKLFYNEQKYEKCFKVLVESQYWFMTLARLYENPHEFRKTRHGLVRRGLYQTMKSCLWTFVTWILDNWEAYNQNFFGYLTKKTINQRELDSINSKISYFKKGYSDYLHQQKLFSISNPHKKELRNDIHYNFVNKLHKTKQISGVMDMLLTTIIYAFDQLNGYNLTQNFKKYTQQRMTLENIPQSFYQIDPNRLSNCLKNIFNTLETYGCYHFITKLARSLNLQKIQELIIIQNLLRIDLSKQNRQQTQDDMELHYQLMGEVTNESQLIDKLSLLLLFFGRGKGLAHQFQQDDNLLSEYMGDFSNIFVKQSCEIIKFKLLKVINQHEFYCFDKYYKETHNKRTLHKGYQYKMMFNLIDDMSPNSFLAGNQKQKQYVEYFKLLTKQQAIQLQEKQKLAVEQKLQQLDRKIRRAKADLEHEEKEKIKIFANTYKQEAQAVEKRNKFMRFIPQYVWLPEECQKKPQKAYTLKKTVDQIKKQRNKILNDVDVKTQTKLQEIRKRVDVLKIIKQLNQTLQIQRQFCNKEHAKYLKKRQQVQYFGQIVQDIYRYIQPKLQGIKQLQSQKKGSNKQDKKLNSRIKIATDNMKQEMAAFNERKKDQEKAKSQLKNIHQKIQGFFANIQQIEHQIMFNKQYICKLKLGTIDQKTKELKLVNSPEYTIIKIKQQVLRWQPELKKQGDDQKYAIKNKYRRILDDVKEFLYFHKTVPEGCQQDRYNIVKKIESLNLEIQRLQKQKEDQKMRTQARVKVNFQSKCFRKHCWQYRQEFIADKILQKHTQKKYMEEELIDVIKIIGRITPPGTKIEKDMINKNSTLLEMIMQSGDSSFEKIFIIVHFFVHEQEMGLLQNIVVKQTYEKFLREMQKFLQNIITSNVENSLVKNTLAIFGINAIETFDDEFKYFEGFSLMERGHNFFNGLRSQFYHNISQSHVLCRTTDIADIMVNFLISKVKAKQSQNIFRVFDLNQFNPVQMQQFKMRNDQFLASYQKQFIEKIRTFDFNKQKKYLTTIDINYIMQNIFDLKMVYFTKMIRYEEDKNINLEIKATQIISIIEKIIEINSLVSNLNFVVQFNKESLKKVDNVNTFINKELEEQGTIIKAYIIKRIEKVMNKLQKIKQQTVIQKNTQAQNQSKNQSQEQKDESKTQQSSLSSTFNKNSKRQQTRKPRKDISRPQRNLRNNNNNNENKRNKNRPRRSFYYEQEEDENDTNQNADKNYQQKVHFDLITGTWVAGN